MAGGGSTQGMINSLRANRLLVRKKKKERTFLNTRKENYNMVKGNIALKNVSETVLEKIRKKTLKQQKRENISIKIMLLILCPLLLWGLYKTVLIIQKDIEYAKIIPKKDMEKYSFFIMDGDTWLEDKKWHNAVFQYKKALEIFPEEYDANYRLALAYAYRCQYENKNCNEGKILVEKLNNSFPNKDALNQLKLKYE